MKKTLFMLIVLFALVLVACSTPSQGTIVNATLVNGVQEVTLSWGQLNYKPDVIRVKSGIPVKIIADTTRLTGCFRALVIPAMGIRKTVTPRDNVIQFTPQNPGEYTFACSMGMGNGRIIVT